MTYTFFPDLVRGTAQPGVHRDPNPCPKNDFFYYYPVDISPPPFLVGQVQMFSWGAGRVASMYRSQCLGYLLLVLLI